MPLVSVFMDVEDPINPLADDAVLAVLKTFEASGVRGSFCVTGEKIRTLVARNRQDVLEGLKAQCLGLHTDTHSQHPTTMELLADVDYDMGCHLALTAERKGFESFVSAFGRKPAFWGGAGNTWSVEIPYALKELQIPAYSYALTSAPGDAIHRFNGVVALPQALSISELEWVDDGKAKAAVERTLAAVKDRIADWLGIFVGHPTKLRHIAYWDLPYNHGRTPPSPVLIEPLPTADFERSLGNLGKFLSRLKSEAEVVGVDQLLDKTWTFRKAKPEELDFFDHWTPQNLRNAAKWPIHRQDLNPENIVRKTMARKETLEIGSLARF